MGLRLRWVLALAGVAVVGGLAGCHAGGQTFVVDTMADTPDAAPGDGVCRDATGACSVRAAVMEANALPGVDAVVLADDAVYSLTIPGTGEDGSATGDLDVTEGLDLRGSGSRIDGSEQDRVLDLHSGVVHVAGVSLSGGSATGGANLRVLDGDHVVAVGRIEDGMGGAGAGGVEVVGGRLQLHGVTVQRNAGGSAGGVEVVGGRLLATNVTVSGNLALGGGAGGIAVTGGTARLEHATVAANSGDVVGGVAGAGVEVVASAVVDQSAGADCAGALASLGGNVESGTTCGFEDATDHQAAAAHLAPLADDGGPTPTHRWSHRSALNGAVPDALCTATVDQRLAPRPAGAPCDAGAVELTDADLIGEDCLPVPAIGPGARLHACDLTDLVLTGDLTGADLSGADLDGARIVSADITDVDLGGISHAGLVTEALTGDPAVVPSGWAYRHGRFWYPGVRLRGALRSYPSWSEVEDPPLLDLRGLDLRGADAAGFEFSGADLSGTDLTGADLRLARFCRWIDEGAGPPANGIEDIYYGIDLTDASLAGADLTGAWFECVDARFGHGVGVDLSGATLVGARIEGMTLTGADLSAARLTGVVLVRCSCVGVDLTDSDLEYLDVRVGDLTNAVFDGARLYGWSLEADETPIDGASFVGATPTSAIPSGF